MNEDLFSTLNDCLSLLTLLYHRGVKPYISPQKRDEDMYPLICRLERLLRSEYDRRNKERYGADAIRAHL